MKIKEISMLLENLYSKPHAETFVHEVEYPAEKCLKKTWEDGTIMETYFYNGSITKTFLNGKYLFTTMPK